MRRAGDWCGASRVGVHGQGIVWGAKDGYRGPEMGVKAFGWVWRPEMSVKGLILV